MKSFIFGTTRLNLPIPAYNFGEAGPKVLLIGGVHGDEVEGVILASALLGAFSKNFSYALQICLVPSLNYDGTLLKTRKNAIGVDLNRNLPSADWTNDVKEERYYPGPKANSEPENQALVQWLDKNKPSLIFSFHSWKPMLNTNGDCQPEAQIIANFTGYEIKESIGYPTPGCLGTYAGLERNMPTITYEIERGLSPEKIIESHLPAILAALKISQERFAR